MKKLKMKFLALLAVLTLLFSCASPSEGVEVKSNSEVVELLKSDKTMIIDVREADELEKLAYDIEGIVNIPLSSFESHLDEIPKDQTIILACRTGNRSLKAANILLESGYENVINMDGGIIAWEKTGFETISTKACCSDPNSEDCNPDGTCKSK